MRKFTSYLSVALWGGTILGAIYVIIDLVRCLSFIESYIIVVIIFAIAATILMAFAEAELAIAETIPPHITVGKFF
jgi:hypothetical protein